MTKRYMKKMLIVTNHEGKANQIKATMRYHLTLIRMVIIIFKRVGEDVEKLEPLYIVSRTAKQCSHYEKQY